MAYVRLCALPSDIAGLIHWAEGLAIEIELQSPADHFAELYRYAKLLDNHPVRVALPVVEGFENAVKLALSLQFSVRLEVGQPNSERIDSLRRLLDDYLYRPTVTQPIELFHTLLMAFCRDEAISLWSVQEEDPARIRYIDEHGNERYPGKLASVEEVGDPAGFVEHWVDSLLAGQVECDHCEFLGPCQGYFKWPRRDYDCAGIKTLLQTLRQAGVELRHDLQAASEATGRQHAT